jgi:CNT family concentrative nucleoside transporter
LFFVSTLAAIIFFIAFVQAAYYIGAMQWIIEKFAWFFFKTLRISGAEAVVAASSPFIGQGESACLVRPYVAMMTPSEIHQTMTSGFATIAGSVLGAYVSLGMPASYLVTSAVMSIPASIAISKLRYPEEGEPLTKGRVVVARDNDDAVNILHAYSNGAWFGLRVAGMILANVATLLSLIAAIDGFLTWTGKSFGIHHLTLELIFQYIFYPIAWLIGVPQGELLTVSRLIGVKLVANEFVAYSDLQPLIPTLSQRAFTIAVFSLCGFANLSSLGIQIGVLSSLADNQKVVISRVGPSALICGFIATLQTAAIAGMLV